MTKTTIYTGIILIILGIVAYFASHAQSITALIPAFFGVPIFILGLIARKESIRKHVIHGALVVALVGLVGSVNGIPQFVSMLLGNDVLRPAAVIVKAIMALILIVYIIMGINSFVQARRDKNK